MATGDILSAVVRADGWSMDVTIEGFAVGATYDFGSLDDTPATVAAPMFSVAVVSEGYNAAGVLGTVARTVYGTHVVRKPYPNQASKDETVSGSDLVVRVALSESIYNDDKNGGAGTSGTNPAVTISAAWATNTGGASQTSAVATALACTNNSTLDYPKVIAQWAWGHTPAFRRVAAAFDIGCIAYHGHGIACVALSATEGVNVVSGTATSKTDHLMSASGLHYESYDLNVPLTSMTQGNDITLRFIAYPVVGDADSITDTESVTDIFYSPNGNTRITCTCDKTGALIDYAVVSTAGNDTTGAKSTTLATAEASPYLTVGKALASGATVIYCRTGTHDILGSTPVSVTARNYYIEIAPYPSESVTLARGGSFQYNKATKTRFSGFTITCAISTGFLQGTQNRIIEFDSCTFSTTTTPSAGLSYTAIGVWFKNCAVDGTDKLAKANGGSMYVFTGCDFSDPVTATVWRTIVACRQSGATNSAFSVATATSTQDPTNIIVAHNEFLAAVQPTDPIFRFNIVITGGVAFVGNLLEISQASTGKCMEMYADGSLFAAEHVVVAHNTIVGNRCNLFYNDEGTAAIVRTNCFIRNNAISSYNIKADLYGTPNANRVGNWAQLNGVNTSDNMLDMTASASFTNDWTGINSKFHSSLALEGPSTDLGFTDDACYYGDGTGNGDYMPTEASVLYDHALRQAYQSYDLYGVEL